MGSISEENGLELKAAMFERKKNHLVSRDKKKSFLYFVSPFSLSAIFFLVFVVGGGGSGFGFFEMYH